MIAKQRNGHQKSTNKKMSFIIKYAYISVLLGCATCRAEKHAVMHHADSFYAHANNIEITQNSNFEQHGKNDKILPYGAFYVYVKGEKLKSNASDTSKLAEALFKYSDKESLNNDGVAQSNIELNQKPVGLATLKNQFILISNTKSFIILDFGTYVTILEADPLIRTKDCGIYTNSKIVSLSEVDQIQIKNLVASIKKKSEEAQP